MFFLGVRQGAGTSERAVSSCAVALQHPQPQHQHYDSLNYPHAACRTRQPSGAQSQALARLGHRTDADASSIKCCRDSVGNPIATILDWHQDRWAAERRGTSEDFAVRAETCSDVDFCNDLYYSLTHQCIHNVNIVVWIAGPSSLAVG